MSSRLNKFRKKLSGDIRKKLYDTQKDQMVANITQPTKDLVSIETKVKEICNTAPLLHQYYYIIFGKEIYKKINKLTGQTLIDELRILDTKWEMRGLDPTLLTAIKLHYFPGYPAPPVGPQPFRLDISLLDGIDFLV